MKSLFKTSDYTRISLMAALISVSGYIIIPLPFSPVPITAQSLAVMVTGSLLSPVHSMAALSLYVLLGLIGLPVFAGGASGVGVLLGPTGGYLVGFVLGAVVISVLKGRKPFLYRYAFANLTGGVVVVYALGVLRLAQVTGMTLGSAFMVGAMPFLVGDVVKVFVASVIAWKTAPHIQQKG